MTLTQACRCDPYHLAVILKCLNRSRSGVSHAAAQTTDHLIENLTDRSPICYAAFDAFGYELLRITSLLVPLEIAITRSCLHGTDGPHTAIHLKLPTLINLNFSWAFGRASQQASDHH